MKFDARVDKRKREEREREQRERQRERRAQREKREKSPLTKMLKQRVGDEVMGRPKGEKYGGELSDNKAKVNLREIY